jgi:tRNA1(Val) A37 N6-methylase TrmN6
MAILPEPAPGPESALSDDGLLDGRLRLLQPRRGYRVAIDPVLLAAAVPARDGDEVLDAGVGTGAAALCLLRRLPACRVVGLDREPEALALAAANAARNGMADRLQLVAGDLLAPPVAVKGRLFDQVMTNPPFHPAAAATAPKAATRRAAHLVEAELAVWLAACLRRLKPRGRLTLIHSADRLDAILAALAGRAGDIALFPLWPRAAVPARRVIVGARKASRAPARLLPGLVLHETDGRFTPAAEAVLRHGMPLHL